MSDESHATPEISSHASKDHPDLFQVAAIVPPGADDAWVTGPNGHLPNTDGDDNGQEPGDEATAPVVKPRPFRFHRWSRRTWEVVIATCLAVVAAVSVPLVITNTGGTSGPAPRYDALIAYDPATRQLLMAGGDAITCNSGSGQECVNNTDSDMWEWTGRTWTSLAATIRATDSFSSATVYDGASRQLLLLSDPHTYAWNGKSWGEMPGAAPVTTFPPVLAYDEATGQVVAVLIGPGGGKHATTWTWLHDRWLELQGTGTPYGALGYDPTTRQLLCVTTPPLAEGGSSTTWMWTGRKWKSLGVENVFPHGPQAMVFDGAARQLLLVQTGPVGGPVNEMWTWTGRTWGEVNPSTAPPRREATAIAYDASTKQLLLFGGYLAYGTTVYNDTWDWNGKTWVKVG